MTRFTARNVSLVLMLVAFPLISVGTTGDRPTVWWLGVAAFTLGALIPPVLRYVPTREKESPRRATDLGESARVC